MAAPTQVGTTASPGTANGADVDYTVPALSSSEVCVIAGGHPVSNSGTNVAGPVNSGTNTPDSNWTHALPGGVDAFASGAVANARCGLWYRKGPYAGGTVTLKGGGNSADGMGYLVWVFTDIDMTNPMDVTPVVAEGSTSPAITTATADALVFAVTCRNVDDTTYSGPSGYSTQEHAVVTDSRRFQITAMRKVVASPGTETPGAWTSLNTGSAVNQSFTFALKPAGGAPPPGQGTATGTIAFVDSLAGKRTPKGTATGTLAFVDSLTGRRDPKGTGAGTLAFTDSLTGKHTPKGTATGSVAFAGSMGGKREPKGSASGTTAFSGSLTGEAPDVGSAEGTAEGTLAFTGSLAGERDPVGTAVGELSFEGALGGEREPKGEAAGALAFSGSLDGKREPEGTATGSLAFVGSLTGEAPDDVMEGTAEGTLIFSGSLDGRRAPVGTGAGSLAFSGSLSGKREPVGATAAGSLVFAGSLAGEREPVGEAVGALAFSGSFAGFAPGTPSGEYVAGEPHDTRYEAGAARNQRYGSDAPRATRYSSGGAV